MCERKCRVEFTKEFEEMTLTTGQRVNNNSEDVTVKATQRLNKE